MSDPIEQIKSAVKSLDEEVTEEGEKSFLEFLESVKKDIERFITLFKKKKLTKEELKEFHYIVPTIVKVYDPDGLPRKYWEVIDKVYKENAKELDWDEIDNIELYGECLKCGEDLEFDDQGVAICNKCGTYYYGFYNEDGEFTDMFMKEND